MKNPQQRYTYWRIGRSQLSGDPTAHRKEADRAAPAGYAFHTTQAGQLVYRKRLPAHVSLRAEGGPY